jgi:hypothetical protein
MAVSNESWAFREAVRFLSLVTVPAGTFKGVDFSVSPTDRMAATQVVHQFPLTYGQAEGADVVSETVPLHVVHGVAGKIIAVQVMTPLAPAGGDKQFTVDIQKGNEATAFASVLDTAVTIDSAVADREVVEGIIDTDTLAAGDALRLVITASGSTGDQAQGLIVTVTIQEDPT